MLMDLDSGLNHKEAGYVADEYYFALQSEQQEAEEYEGRTVYPRWGRGGGYGGTTYGWSRYERTSTGYPIPPRTYISRHPWEQPSGTLTEDRLMEILAQRDREFEERLKRTKLEDQLTKLVENVTKLAMEVKNIKENPPVAIPPNVVTKDELEKQRADQYVKTLERQIAAMEKTVEKYERLIEKAEDRHKEELKELQQRYEKQLEKLYEELKEARRHASRPTEGYKEDTYR